MHLKTKIPGKNSAGVMIVFLLLIFPSTRALDSSSADYSSNETFIVQGIQNSSSADYNSLGVISYTAPVMMNSSIYESRISLIDADNLTFPRLPAPPPSGEEPPPVTPTGGGAAGIDITPNLTLGTDVIKVTLAQGQTKTEKLMIKNSGNTKLNVSLATENVGGFLYFSDDGFWLELGEEKEVTVAVTARDNEFPEVYTGRIIVSAGGLRSVVIVVIEVKEKSALFDVSAILPQGFKRLRAGQNVTADILLYNFGTLMPVDVQLAYEIRDMDGNVVDSRHETLAVNEQLLLQRTFAVPEYVKKGYYLFYARLDYGNQTATGSDLFMVMQEDEFALLDMLLTYWQVILGSLIGLGGGLFFYRRRKSVPAEATAEQNAESLSTKENGRPAETIEPAPEPQEQAPPDEKEWEKLSWKYRKLREEERQRLEEERRKLAEEAEWVRLEEKYRRRPEQRSEREWERLVKKYRKNLDKNRKPDLVTEDQWERMIDRYRGRLDEKKRSSR